MKNRARSLVSAIVVGAGMGVSTLTYAAQNVAYSLSNGRYAGRREYAYYGYVRVEAVVRRGRLSEVRVLEYPHDNGTSRYINGVALPYLVREAVRAQSFRVDLVSGATFTSTAFARSLRDALHRAGA